MSDTYADNRHESFVSHIEQIRDQLKGLDRELANALTTQAAASDGPTSHGAAAETVINRVLWTVAHFNLDRVAMIAAEADTARLTENAKANQAIINQLNGVRTFWGDERVRATRQLSDGKNADGSPKNVVVVGATGTTGKTREDDRIDVLFDNGVHHYGCSTDDIEAES